MKRLSRLVLFGAIGFGLWMTVNLEFLATHLDMALLWAVLAAQPLFVLSNALLAARIRWFVVSFDVGFWRCLRAVNLSIGLNLVFPARLSEFIKPVYLRKHGGVPFSVGMSAVFVERLTDMAVLLSMTLIAVLLINQSYLTEGLFVIVVVVIVVGVAAWKVDWLHARIERLIPGTKLKAFIRAAVENVNALRNTSGLWLGAGAGVLAWVCSYIGVLIFFAVAGSHSLTPMEALAVFVATTIGGAIAILPAGFGAYEGAAVFALTQLGYPLEEALVLAVALHVTNLLYALIVSMIIVSSDRVGVSDFAAEISRHLRR